MINRRDIASIAGYSLLFAAVVLWAELRPANPDLAVSVSTARESARPPVGTNPVDLAGDQPEMRHLAKHMRIP